MVSEGEAALVISPFCHEARYFQETPGEELNAIARLSLGWSTTAKVDLQEWEDILVHFPPERLDSSCFSCCPFGPAHLP